MRRLRQDAMPTDQTQGPFLLMLKCVRALVDFTLMAQYRSHIPATLSYMETPADISLDKGHFS